MMMMHEIIVMECIDTALLMLVADSNNSASR
jgi:hypothetical protein